MQFCFICINNQALCSRIIPEFGRVLLPSLAARVGVEPTFSGIKPAILPVELPDYIELLKGIEPSTY